MLCDVDKASVAQPGGVLIGLTVVASHPEAIMHGTVNTQAEAPGAGIRSWLRLAAVVGLTAAIAALVANVVLLLLLGTKQLS